MLVNVADFLSALAQAFVRQLVVGVGLLAALGLALSLTQGALCRALLGLMGTRGVVLFTGWLGTPVHELSHVVVAWVCRIEITQVKLWEPDPRNGVLGFVRYRVPQRRLGELHKIVGTFLMGVAPLFGGALFLWAALSLLAPDAGLLLGEATQFATRAASAPPPEVARGFAALVRRVVDTIFAAGALSWRPWLFLYLALCVGAHLAPSRADLEGGLTGLAAALVLLLFVDAAALLLGADPLRAATWAARAAGPVAAMLLLALTLNLGNLAVTWAALALARLVRS